MVTSISYDPFCCLKSINACFIALKDVYGDAPNAPAEIRGKAI